MTTPLKNPQVIVTEDETESPTTLSTAMAIQGLQQTPLNLGGTSAIEAVNSGGKPSTRPCVHAGVH